jgi:hypothetical protein
MKTVDTDVGERGQHASRQRRHVGVVAGIVLADHRGQPAVVALIGRFPRLTGAEFLVGRGHLGQATQDEVELDRHGLLDPQGAVVVEHRDPVSDRDHGSRTARPIDEAEDGVPGRTLVPARQDLGHAPPPKLHADSQHP